MKLLILLALFLSALCYGQEHKPVDLSKVQKVYYLLASSQGFSRSAFGHGYLRLSETDKPSSQDYVIEFVADVLDKDLNYLRALGLGKNYQRKVVIKRYAEIIPEMNNIKDRDLTSYEIILDDNQKKQLINLISESYEKESYGEYTFLNKNCAQAVSSLLSSVGVNIKGLTSIIPTEVPNLLFKKELIGDVYIDYGISGKRRELYSKYEDTIIKTSAFMEYQINESDLYSDDIFKRMTSYAQLSNVLDVLPNTQKLKLKSYLRSFLFFENKVTRKSLLNQLDNKQQINNVEFVELGKKVNSALSNLSINFSAKIDSVNFIYQDKILYLEYKIKIFGKKNGRSASKFVNKFYRHKLSNVTIKNETEIYIKNMLVGNIVSDNLNDRNVIITNAWVSDHSYFDKASKEIKVRSKVTIQKNLNDLASNTKVLNESDENILKNNIKNYPMCFALVDLQKKMLENLIFLPEYPALAEDKNFQLFGQLLNDQIVVVPGYNNIREWTASLDQKKLIKLVYTYQKKNYTSISSALNIYTEQISLNKQNLLLLKSLANRKIYTPVFFRTKSKKGHAVLVTNIIEVDEANYLLEVYDPNSGFSKDIFRFNSNTNKLSSFLYGEGSAYFLPSNILYNLYKRDLVEDEELNKLMIWAAKKYDTFSFKPSNFQKIY